MTIESHDERPPRHSDDRKKKTRRRRRKRSNRVTRARAERLLDAIYEANEDLAEVARSEGLTLRDLARWANEPVTAATLDGLCRLHDAKAQVLLSRYRTLAAAKLFELSGEPDASREIVRKACVDLLKLSVIEPVASLLAATGGGEDASAPELAFDLGVLDELRDLMRAAGDSDLDDEDEDDHDDDGELGVTEANGADPS
ncbi:MAG: hypothetical protein ACF8PN_05365 [Phycisphaerales bacterium]